MKLASATASTLLLAAIAAPSYAQLSIGAGMERYVSTESLLQKDERGWRKAAWLQFVAPVHKGWTFGYYGKVYTGTVDYNDDGPAATIRVDKQEYRGMANELQVRYREASDRQRRLDGIIGIGFDNWRQHLVTTDTTQNWQVGYLRFGFEFDTVESSGVNYGAGIRLPVFNTVNLHLDQMGFDNNPRISPRGRLSFYGQAGYRVGVINLVAFVDSYRLDDSGTVELFQGGVSQGNYYLPARDIWMYGLRLELGTW